MSLAVVFANSLTGEGVEHAGMRWVADGSVRDKDAKARLQRWVLAGTSRSCRGSAGLERLSMTGRRGRRS